MSARWDSDELAEPCQVREYRLRRKSDYEDNYQGEPVRGIVNGLCVMALVWAFIAAVGWILVN